MSPQAYMQQCNKRLKLAMATIFNFYELFEL